MGAPAFMEEARFIVPGISVTATERLADVEAAWRGLEAQGIDNPGQGIEFVRAWLDHFAVREEDRLFLLAQRDDHPLMLLPLQRKRSVGFSAITWLTGDHLGMSAPLVDKPAFAMMTDFDKHQLWNRLTQLPLDADMVNLSNLPTDIARLTGLGEFFTSVPAADRVFRARFPGWEACDADRRNKHRRKVDRQQGAKLDALGEIGFEVLVAGDPVADVIDTMFVQKAARFRELGIADPFAAPRVRAFYKDAFRRARGVLQVLRLDGRIIAVRYNLSAGGGLFCLISSMTTCPQTQAGSPGKQGLLRVMQTAFGDGHAFIDMGRGENDEKRQWCNEEIEIAHYSHALTPLGHLARAGQQFNEHVRTRIKGNRNWFDLAKRLRRTVAGRS